MKNLLIILLFFVGSVLCSCGKGDDPQPIICEQGGTEVTLDP
jgi:hypothetical protein